MKAAGIFISSIIIVDTFLVSYAVGFNSRHVLVIDPKLPPVKVEKPAAPSAATAKADTKADNAKSNAAKADGAKSDEFTASKDKDKQRTGDSGNATSASEGDKWKKHHKGKTHH